MGPSGSSSGPWWHPSSGGDHADPPGDPGDAEGEDDGPATASFGQRAGAGARLVSDGALSVLRTGPAVLSWIERRRVESVLDGSSIMEFRNSQTGELHRMFQRRSAVGLVVRLLPPLALLLAVLFGPALPPWLYGVLGAVGHGWALSRRRVLVGAQRAVVMFALPAAEGLTFLLALFVGLDGLVVTVWSIGWVCATLAVWRVDFELVSAGGRFVRCAGFGPTRCSGVVGLLDVKSVQVQGPFMRFGFVDADTAAQEDLRFKGFGLIYRPDRWEAALARARKRVPPPRPFGDPESDE